MLRLGIMQGRFVNKGGFYPQQFPENCWKDEFYIANKNGVESIEWMIAPENYKDNPIFKSTKEVHDIRETMGVCVSGICINSVMTYGLLEKNHFKENVDLLKRLTEIANEIGCNSLTIPLFGQASFSVANEWQCERLMYLMDCVDNEAVRILFETDEDISDFVALLQGKANFGLTYDIGNATGNGHDAFYELATYLEYIKNVHFKDKTIGGATVMLGAGDSPYDRIIPFLKEHYDGYGIFESYYGVDAVGDTLKNIEFVRSF